MTQQGGVLLFIGCGNMGGALASGLRGKWWARLLFYDIDGSRSAMLAAQTGGESVVSLPEALKEADTVVLAVKPQSFPKLMAEAGKFFHDNQVIISIMAGVTLHAITTAIAAQVDAVRAMPNTPALVGEGCTGFCGGTETAQKIAESLFSGVGIVLKVEESAMDAVTAVSGSGPAYFFYFLETYIKAAEAQGFSHEEANTLVVQTVSGALKLFRESGESAEVLRARVTSPGGTTEAAVNEMKALGFEQLLPQAIGKAVARSRILGK